jgi:hypothetical protein
MNPCTRFKKAGLFPEPVSTLRRRASLVKGIEPQFLGHPVRSLLTVPPLNKKIFQLNFNAEWFTVGVFSLNVVVGVRLSPLVFRL